MTKTETPGKRWRKAGVRLLLLLLGVGLLGLFIRAAGAREIVSNLRRIGWGFFWLVGLSLVWRSLASTAMYLILPKGHGLSWIKVMAIRTAGESVNTLMPFGNVGGEPVKAVMLAREMGGTESTGTVLLDKTIFFLASVGFMLTGTLSGAFVLGDHPKVYALSIALLVPWIALLGLVVWRQMKGDLVAQVSRLTKLFRIHLKPKTLEKLRKIDGVMSTFYRERRGRFFAAFLVHSLARSLRIIDVWLCVKLIGVTISLGAAYLTAAVGMLVSSTFFFIPGALGAAEGGQGYVLELLGPGAAVGVAIALVRRMRNYFVSIFAYGLVVAWPTGPKPPPDEPPSTDS